MGNNNKILLISDDGDFAEYAKAQISLLRNSDEIKVCSPEDNIKKIIENTRFSIVILKELDSQDATLKLIKSIKNKDGIIKILLVTNSNDNNYMFSMFDAGVCEFLNTTFLQYEIITKIINFYKMAQLEIELNRDKKLLKDLGVINNKTEMYESKYISQIYSEIYNNPEITNGAYIILTIDPKIKTKVSTNRLSLILKNNTRNGDILASSRNGKFHLILTDIKTEDVKNFISKIQKCMGDDIPLRAGYSRIGIQDYETLEKNTNDSLKSAIQNDELCVSLTDNDISEDLWINNENKKNKQYKLFAKVYEEKLNKVISVIFYRFQKDFEIKLTNTQVIQYTNNVESVFSLKNDNAHSELIIRPTGPAKLIILIQHKGLNSPENTKNEITINKLNEKELSKYLNKMKNEYCQTAYK